MSNEKGWYFTTYEDHNRLHFERLFYRASTPPNVQSAGRVVQHHGPYPSFSTARKAAMAVFFVEQEVLRKNLNKIRYTKLTDVEG